MRDLFLEMLNKQPTAQILFGGDAGKESSDKGKDASDKGKDASDGPRNSGGITLTSTPRYEISPEKQLFIVIFKDKSTHCEINQNLLNQHLAYLRHLTEKGSLMVAGAYASGDQGVMLIRATSLSEAATIVEGDPLFKAGYYGKADIDQVVSRVNIPNCL
ncbi:Protein yciI [Bacillus cereus]|uniref:YciI family protein n=1 Tax=Bacillus wiedmannii TaxID=1890302 RepID=UPI0008176FF1|nr:YciI family protein [Bacillus wiedmannii]WMS85382.1 YciI family protein [Bacillus wiedmannii]SCC24303.1 Protein yciI [Bacillus cereus]